MPPPQIDPRLAYDTVHTVMLQLMPLLGLMNLIAYIDRHNISYAKLDMVGDSGLNETGSGLGKSMFLLGYFRFEVAGNVFMERVGGFAWQKAVPLIRDRTGSNLATMYFPAACLALGAGSTTLVRSDLCRDAL